MLSYSSIKSNSMQYQPIEIAYPKVVVSLPKSYLGYNTNNKYPQFPPKMADGRSLLSSWQPESKINETIINDNKIVSNWMYRQHLNKNAKMIMESNFIETANDTGYQIPPVNTTNDKNVPYLYSNIKDTTKPFGYHNSDLKDLYMSREQLNAMKVIPSFNM
jgi:hypothetical protein